MTSDADGKPVESLVLVSLSMGEIWLGGECSGQREGALWEVKVQDDAEMFSPGLLSMHVSAEGYVGKSVSLAGIPFVDDVMSVAVSLQPFPPERQVYGRLLDPEGRPVGHGFISCWPASMRMSEAYEEGALISQSTLKDGSFRFNHPAALKEDPPFLLWVDDAGEGDGLGGVFLTPHIAKAGAEAILRIEAAVETISGRVLDAEGAPAVRATVSARFEGLEEKYLGPRDGEIFAGRSEEHRRDFGARWRRAKTDAEGRFVLRGLQAGMKGRVTAEPAPRPTPGRGPGIYREEGAPIRGWTGVAAGASDLEIRLGEGEDLRPCQK